MLSVSCVCNKIQQFIDENDCYFLHLETLPSKCQQLSAVGADEDLSLLAARGTVGLDPADEEVDALLHQGGRPRPLHGLRLVLAEVAVDVGGLVVPQLDHVVPRPLPVEVDNLPGGDTGLSLLTSHNPVDVKTWKERSWLVSSSD